jgi:hypothetical protein
VTVRRADEQPLVLARSGEAGAKLRVAEPPDPPSQDEVALGEVMRAFEYLTFLDVKPASELPGVALGEARFEFTRDLAVTAWPSLSGDTLWVRLRAEGGEDAPALNARWQGWVFQLGAWKEKALLPRLGEVMELPPTPAQAPAQTPAPPRAPEPAAEPAPQQQQRPARRR